MKGIYTSASITPAPTSIKFLEARPLLGAILPSTKKQLTIYSTGQMRRGGGHTSPGGNHHLNIGIDESLSAANNCSVVRTVHSLTQPSHPIQSNPIHTSEGTPKKYLYKSYPAASADPLVGILALAESLLMRRFGLDFSPGEKGVRTFAGTAGVDLAGSAVFCFFGV